MIINRAFCNIAGYEWLRACYLVAGSGSDRAAAQSSADERLEYVARSQLSINRINQCKRRALRRIGF